eukprot:COSAG02_NODE_6399_length_3599_cov_3.590857_4_plen_84_part_00
MLTRYTSRSFSVKSRAAIILATDLSCKFRLQRVEGGQAMLNDSVVDPAAYCSATVRDATSVEASDSAHVSAKIDILSSAEMLW